ncbi:YPO3983 family protein [Pantoea agglomerans]|uniref:YPO3983 family protein n=1 Tax=Enterobacter agglomerans TaxID=549 RepID=UPI001782BD02|nr:YPO3983 family protein [Pantoea agglomerans]WVL90692.1 YPO3983 family protein [Pantoea agglomerans]
MTALQFPCTIFQTQNRMDDNSAKDMCCGDLSESQLKTHFHLLDVSTRANPYHLTKITPFTQPQSMFYGFRGEGEKITRQQCANILFDEFRDLSRLFSIYGPYKHLIEKMITHMQYGNGKPFTSMHLDGALKEHILRENSTENSTRLRLEKAFNTFIDWENKCYPAKEKDKLRKVILDSKLPKFDRFQDNFNGMGITVHDTWATHITIKSLQIDNDHYRVVVHYKVQDHFGLDCDDISKFKFNQFRFFRIWFVLQRYNQFGFKPFMTNMEAAIEINGDRK